MRGQLYNRRRIFNDNGKKVKASVRTMDTLDDDPAGSQGPRTLRRGLAVLRCLQSASSAGLTVTALAQRSGLQRPTVYRLLSALLESGFVREVPGSKRFAANDVPATGSNALPPDRRIELALPVMRSLAEATGDAVFLVVRDDNESLTLWREIGPYPVQILATFAGKRQPLGVGSGGLALLATLPDDAVENIIQRNSDKLELYGGMTPREMWQLVRNTRTRGYSVVGNYAVRGALGVASALCDKRGEPQLSISVTAITERMPATRQRDIAALIRQGLDSLADRV